MRNSRFSFCFLLVTISGLLLSGCNSNDSSSQLTLSSQSTEITSQAPIETFYTITWKNFDGEILEIDSGVSRGSIPSYNGSTPKKTGDAQYTYTFTGWSPEITAVSQDVTYVAQYSSSVNHYTVTWNVDGNVTTESYAYGETPTFKGSTSKDDDAQYTYTFTGWSPEVVAVTQDATYAAQYSSSVNHYTITWNVDGNVTSEDYAYGETPTFKGSTAKASDAQYTYTFTGWSPEITAVSQDVTYVAQYSSSVNHYTITWNVDGQITSEYYAYGDTPTFNGSTAKASDAQYTYTFTGWSPEVVAVTHDITYVAQYSSSVNHYTITWNVNGQITSEDYAYGETPTFKGSTAKASDAQYTYTFTGWSPEITTVTQDMTYTAQYSSSVNHYTLDVSSEDTSRGSVTIIEGSGYACETITVVATPYDSYYFGGWYHNSLRVNGDLVFSFTMPLENCYLVAKFYNAVEKQEIDNNWDINHGLVPNLSDDGKTFTYGLYPQSKISDSLLISSLNKLEEASSNGWYYYDGEYYAKVSANPYLDGSVFENGDPIVSGEIYWFICSPIEWIILANDGNKKVALSCVLLDTHVVFESYSSKYRNYWQSDMRNWLNNDFYYQSFSLGDNYVCETSFTPTSSTEYFDKVFLLSSEDYLNDEYGFGPNGYYAKSRYCKTTDWSRANKAEYSKENDLLFNGWYWTRDFAYVGRSGCILYKGASTLADNFCARPAITVSF